MQSGPASKLGHRISSSPLLLLSEPPFPTVRYAVAVLAILCAADSLAAVTTYNDDTSFKAAVGATTTYGFDTFTLTEGPDIHGFYLPLDQQIPGLDFDNSRVNVGAFGGTFNSPPNVVQNSDYVNPIVINFLVPQMAVGLYNTSIVDAERVDIYDSNNTVIGSIDLDANAINFGGFVSTIPISKITVTPIAPTNGVIFIDDLVLAAIPEPSSTWLFAAGLAAILFRTGVGTKRTTSH